MFVSNIDLSLLGIVMDSLTARLMSQAGLSKAQPLLPPVHGLRPVYLREELSQADKDLHSARVALQELEKNPSFPKRDALLKAMAKLEKREQDYFKRRYMEPKEYKVIQGWSDKYYDDYNQNVDVNADPVKKMVKEAKKHLQQTDGYQNNSSVRKAAVLAHRAVLKLEDAVVFRSVYDTAQLQRVQKEIGLITDEINALNVPIGSLGRKIFEEIKNNIGKIP